MNLDNCGDREASLAQFESAVVNQWASLPQS